MALIKAKVNSRRAILKLKGVERKADKLPYSEIGRILDDSIDRNFASGGRYSSPNSIFGGSKTWERLKGSTRRPLEDTGTLRRSITYRVQGNQVELYSDNSVANVYGTAQNFGYPPRNLVARPFMVIQSEDDKRIEDVLAKHFGTGKK